MGLQTWAGWKNYIDKRQAEESIQTSWIVKAWPEKPKRNQRIQVCRDCGQVSCRLWVFASNNPSRLWWCGEDLNRQLGVIDSDCWRRAIEIPPQQYFWVDSTPCKCRFRQPPIKVKSSSKKPIWSWRGTEPDKGSKWTTTADFFRALISRRHEEEKTATESKMTK